MENKLNFRGKECLRVLNLEIGPKKTWSLRTRQASYMFNTEIIWENYKIYSDRKILAQCILMNFWHPEALDGHYILSTQDRQKCITLTRILMVAEELFPNKRFCDLERSDCIKICFLSLFRKWAKSNILLYDLIPTEEPLSAPLLVRSVTVMNDWYSLYINGDVSDGPEFKIAIADVEILLKPEFKKLGKSFSDWKNGASFGTIPFGTAHLLLMDALTLIQSKQTKRLLAYFSFIKERNCEDLVRPFWASAPRTRISQYRRSGDTSLLDGVTHDSIVSNRVKCEFALPLHEELLKLNDKDEPFVFSWPTHRDLVHQYNELQTAIYIVFLSIMGKRGPSEIQGFRAADIIPSNSDSGYDAVMKPRIFKSHHGFQATQGVTNFIDEVLETLLNLGYSDKKKNNDFLFVSLPFLPWVNREPARVSTSQMAVYLRDYFEKFCIRMIDKLEFSIKDTHENLQSHQFRHAFAEFALRRYDGSVEELIRQHFCHSYNHWWTKRYTADKLDTDREQYLSKEYIKELVPQILRDAETDQDFVGAMAVYIKRDLAPKIKLMNALDSEDYVNRFCSSVLQITPHEYGWCLLHENFRSVAKCADVKGIPNPLATSSSKCIGCANFCASRKSHLAAQTQIAISHLDFIESNVWKMPRLKNASIAAVRNAQNLFPELRELGTIE